MAVKDATLRVLLATCERRTQYIEVVTAKIDRVDFVSIIQNVLAYELRDDESIVQ